jgi:putative Mg2+ transporter-C (MgtC) family protein
MDSLHLFATWWDGIQQSMYLRLSVALLLGAMIGAERQWRQRAAGMRTNTLVCLAAAAFVDLGVRLAGPTSLSVIAYVVSGVGFLGAGAIIKDGAEIRGLNTAATLWCSAAVGASAGSGQMQQAFFLTFLLMIVNLFFRPLSRFIDRKSVRAETNILYRVHAVCSALDESAVRSHVLKTVAQTPFILRQLRTEDAADPDEVQLHLEIESAIREDALIEQLLSELREDGSVTAVELGEGSCEVE